MQRKQRLAFKQPEIEKCLASVKLLAAQKEEGTEVCGGVGGGYLGRVGLAGRPMVALGPLPGIHIPGHSLNGVRNMLPCGTMALPALPGMPQPLAMTDGYIRCAPLLLESQAVLDFALSDQVFAKARLANVEAVNLWLGAGVMLEYSLPDAQQLLVRPGAGARHGVA